MHPIRQPSSQASPPRIHPPDSNHYHQRSPPPPMLHPADPPPASTHQSLARPPAKRSRKAINCEPCRASKLKCDRARPCSSCVLRGTSALCYPGDPRIDTDPLRVDESSRTTDPAQELTRLRQIVSNLEAHFARNPPWTANGAPPSSHIDHSPHPLPLAPLKQENPEPPAPQHADFAPATLAVLRTGDGGLYAGPTSVATHFAALKIAAHEDQDDDDDANSVGSDPGPSDPYSNRDFDLLAMLPEVSIVDGLLSHYFEACQWENRYLHYHAFNNAWARFKSNVASDRLVLATVFMVLAVAIQFLPPRHRLIETLHESPSDLSENYYNIGRTALQRYHAERRTYSLELIELLLLRAHYLSITKDQCEDLWTLRGELVSTAVSMGLHRDPGRWKMPTHVAERRRWAWWNIMRTERWQAFMFGRPISISNRHFDTQFPSGFDTSYDPTGRLHLPHIHLFRLAEALGDILDDALSVRPVPYERVQYHDKVLERWSQTLPDELQLDDYRLASALSSPVLASRRSGTQSLCLRVFFLHVRFSLHRPYSDGRWPQSLDTAINAAAQLTHLAGQARPDFLANECLAVPGHLNWGPYHAFSAAMFFAFLLIQIPEQPAAHLFRTNVRRVMVVLEHLRGIVIAERGLAILNSLTPLFEEPPPADPEERAHKRMRVLNYARSLPFPCHDSPGFMRRPTAQESASPPQPLASSPATSISPPSAHAATPAMSAAALPSQQQHVPPPPQHPQQHGPPTQYTPARVYEHAPPYGEEQQQVWGVDSGDWAPFISTPRSAPDAPRAA